MKSKAPLILMEQMVMLLVFALASALCLQAFIKADNISLRIEERTSAAIAAQDAAEMIRYGGGDLEYALSHAGELLGGTYTENELSIVYDEEWNITEGEGAYRLTAEGISVEEPRLKKALVQVVSEGKEDSEVLFELQVAWLEVIPDE